MSEHMPQARVGRMGRRDACEHACEGIDTNRLTPGLVGEMAGLLQEIAGYFDQYADAEYLPGQSAPTGNKEMRLMSEINILLKQIGKG